MTTEEITRNRVRNEVIPILEELHPGCSLRISSLAERISQLKEEKQILLDFIIENITLDRGISRHRLNAFPLTVRISIIAHWIKSNGVPSLSAKSLEKLIIQMEPNKAKGSINFKKNWYISWERDYIIINSFNQQ